VVDDVFRSVNDGFRTVDDGFRAVNDGFRVVDDGFRAVNDGFRVVYDVFRAECDGFRAEYNGFRAEYDVLFQNGGEFMTIRTYDQMIDTLQLMKVNLPTYQTEVDATAADITWVSETLNNMVFVRTYCETYDANKKAAFEIKGSFFNGPEGGPVSDFATTAAAVIPNPPLVGGVLFTLRDMAARFKLGPGYTDEIGIALGIEGPEGEAPDPGSVLPVIDVFGAQSGFVFSIVVTNRGQSDMWQALVAPVGTTNWTIAGTGTGKSADITYAPGGATDEPVQLQVRVQLRKSNANYGQPSAIVLVTVNP
jgi:hypothetical protein